MDLLSATSAIMGNSSNSPWGGCKTLTRAAAAAAATEVMTAVWSRPICNNAPVDAMDAGHRNCDLSVSCGDQISEATRTSLEWV